LYDFVAIIPSTTTSCSRVSFFSSILIISILASLTVQRATVVEIEEAAAFAYLYKSCGVTTAAQDQEEEEEEEDRVVRCLKCRSFGTVFVLFVLTTRQLGMQYTHAKRTCSFLFFTTSIWQPWFEEENFKFHAACVHARMDGYFCQLLRARQ
jgi:hypothetical protein